MSEVAGAELWIIRYRDIPRGGDKPLLVETTYLFGIHPVEWAARAPEPDDAHYYTELESVHLVATGFEAHRPRDLIVAGGALEVESA